MSIKGIQEDPITKLLKTIFGDPQVQRELAERAAREIERGNYSYLAQYLKDWSETTYVDEITAMMTTTLGKVKYKQLNSEEIQFPLPSVKIIGFDEKDITGLDSKDLFGVEKKILSNEEFELLKSFKQGGNIFPLPPNLDSNYETFSRQRIKDSVSEGFALDQQINEGLFSEFDNQLIKSQTPQIYTSTSPEVGVFGEKYPEPEPLGFDSPSLIPDTIEQMDTRALDEYYEHWDGVRNENIDKETLSFEQILGITHSAFGGMASIMGSFYELSGSQSKELFALNKAFSIGQAVINTYEGATKAIAQGGILGPIMAASVIAAGLANVAKIASTQPGSKSSGGSSVGKITKPSLPSLNSVSSPQTSAGNATTNNNNQKTINVTITGDVVSPQKYVREVLGPELRKAVGDGAIEFNFN